MKIMFYMIVIVLILFAVAHMSVKKENQIAHIFGFGFLSLDINDLSENQLFKNNDLLIVSMIDTLETSDLQVGDIVIYYDKSVKSFQTKEILEIQTSSNEIITMSTDNLNTIKTINQSDVVALYNYKITYIGNVISYLQTPSGFALCIILPILIVCAYQSTILLKNISSIHKDKIKKNYSQDIKVAHKLFLEEKQKIKDAMFRDYMKHQRK
jgi:signal peptidase I